MNFRSTKYLTKKLFSTFFPSSYLHELLIEWMVRIVKDSDCRDNGKVWYIDKVFA